MDDYFKTLLLYIWLYILAIIGIYLISLCLDKIVDKYSLNLSESFNTVLAILIIIFLAFLPYIFVYLS